MLVRKLYAIAIKIERFSFGSFIVPTDLNIFRYTSPPEILNLKLSGNGKCVILARLCMVNLQTIKEPEIVASGCGICRFRQFS